ncbi:MAG: response regulator [Kiritimatiellia bacterium]
MNKETILLIDDNAVNNQLVATYLLPCGYTIRIAENGRDGLRMAVENPPDIVLLDVMMPEMDGYDVCRQLRKMPETADIPVLFITADASPENHKRAFNVGGNDFITKPIYESVLKTRVSNLINLFNSRKELVELNRHYDLAQKISLTGHWMCYQHFRRKPVCHSSAQLIDILAIPPDMAETFAMGEFLSALTSNAVERERIVRKWITARNNCEDFRELIICKIKGKKKNLRVWVQFESGNGYLQAFGSVQDVTGLMEMLYEAAKLQNEVADNDRYNSMVESGTQLAHELNQPLASITMNVNATRMFLENGDFDRDELCEIIRDVETEVMRAKKVVERMRNVAMHKPLQLEEFDLHKLIYDTMRLYQSDFALSNFTFSLKDMDAPLHIVADRGGVQQILVNLIKNAYESLQDSESENPQVELRTLKKDEAVCIYVSDNGAGVSSAISSSLFTPFVTTKQDNLGLGLPVSRSIATRLGGSIEYLRECDRKGAVFCVVLPEKFKAV